MSDIGNPTAQAATIRNPEPFVTINFFAKRCRGNVDPTTVITPEIIVKLAQAISQLDVCTGSMIYHVTDKVSRTGL
jgi:hypothetical protein